MVEMLFAGGQIVSLAALFYGGWLCIAHAGCMESDESLRRERLAPHRDGEERVGWQHYLAWDA